VTPQFNVQIGEDNDPKKQTGQIVFKLYDGERFFFISADDLVDLAVIRRVTKVAITPKAAKVRSRGLVREPHS
jgi:hypothetical protein